MDCLHVIWTERKSRNPAEHWPFPPSWWTSLKTCEQTANACFISWEFVILELCGDSSVCYMYASLTTVMMLSMFSWALFHPPPCVSASHVALAILHVLNLNMNFRISFSVSTKHLVSILNDISLNLWINLGKVNIFNNLTCAKLQTNHISQFPNISFHFTFIAHVLFITC